MTAFDLQFFILTTASMAISVGGGIALYAALDHMHTRIINWRARQRGQGVE